MAVEAESVQRSLAFFFFLIQPHWSCCSVTQLCPTLWDPVDWSPPGFPVLHYLLEFAQIHVHWVSDAIRPSCPLSPSSRVLNLSTEGRPHQGLFQWVGSSHQVVKVLKLQLQHQSFQWICRGLLFFFFSNFSALPEYNWQIEIIRMYGVPSW